MKHLLIAALFALTACNAETDHGAGDSGVSYPQTRAACLDRGGRWAPGGLWPEPLCFLPNADAGKACERGSDCAGDCLSDTRTCAPESPIFGCYGFLDEDGAEVRICVD